MKGLLESQERLVSFLESPASYPHRPPEVRSIQTHISWVFIAPPFVFKVKKPVNFGFLNFSTLEKRHHFCQRELELNRRLCPKVYLGVVPIYKSGSGFSFNAEGEIAEYSVKMRSTDENFAQVEPFVEKTISPFAFETIRHFTNSFYATNEDLFRNRIRQHRIRDCHGDLHLDHVHLTPEATTIFDCIEFNDRFRFTDIANDLAFLAMDFDFEGKRELGNLLLRNAARKFRDPGMLKITNFYKCYRAFVRGKVESIQATASDAEDIVGWARRLPNSEEHEKQAARYFRLALRYATSGSEPLVLVVMGRVGAGKTTVARQLGAELDWPVFSSDQIRKTLAGVALTERTAPELRDKIYSERMTEQTYKKLLEHGLLALETHNGVVLDATFSSRAHREFLHKECENARVGFQFVELDVDLGEIERRLRARNESTKEISDARLEDLEKLNATYEPPSELAPDLIKISADNSVSDTVKAVLQQLAEKSARSPQRIRPVAHRTDSSRGEQLR